MRRLCPRVIYGFGTVVTRPSRGARACTERKFHRAGPAIPVAKVDRPVTRHAREELRFRTVGFDCPRATRFSILKTMDTK